MDDLSGRYASKRTKELIFINSGAVLILNSDSLFNYSWHTGSLLSGVTKGKWYIDGNDIVLNSQFQPENINLINNVKVHNQPGQYDIFIKIVNEQGKAVANQACIIDRGYLDEVAITDSLGIARFNNGKINRIIIPYDRAYIYNSQAVSGNFYEIILPCRDFRYYFFTNERWMYKKHRIYQIPYSQRKVNSKNYLKKVTTR
ncbi:MAG TPA: hypothetical protein VK172_15060 [Lentimicrobium sp.]|jgi:hypothetical protein|nr:hypothetical protein [Lentimicrobium sp.]